MFIKRNVFIGVLLILLVLAGCGSNETGPNLVFSEIWGRPSPMANGNSAIFMTIENTGNENDRLIGVTSDVAEVVEMHQTTMVDDIMQMQHVDGIDLLAGEQALLMPGGYHIMLIGLVGPLEAGTTISITLEFEISESITLEAEIRQ